MTLYWCAGQFDQGRLYGFRLTKFDSNAAYDLPADLSGCDCPDRPGDCRHRDALRQALARSREGGAA